MDGQYAERVRAVTDHVRANLMGDLRLDVLADVAHFSPYHFHRIFKAVTGETVAEHVRRARLERAIGLMKAAPTKTIGSIAIESGFSSQSDFSRVFRSAYGMAPSSWDRISRLAADDVPIPRDDRDGPGRFGAPDHPIATTIRNHPPSRVVTIRVRDPWRNGRLAASYERFTQDLSSAGVDWRAAQLIGMSWDSYDSTPMNQVTFDIGFIVEDASVPSSGGHVVSELPAVRSVEAHSDGPMIGMAQAWDHLYLEWLPTSGYEPADLPAMTRFRRRPDVTGWDHWDVDCCIAVQPMTR